MKYHQPKTFDAWAAQVIALFRMAGADVHHAWALKLPRFFDAGMTPSDAVRVIYQRIKV